MQALPPEQACCTVPDTSHKSQLASQLSQLSQPSQLSLTQANVSTMVSNRLSLLYEDSMERVAAASVQLTVLLPGLHIDR